MSTQDKIKKLLAGLPRAVEMTPLELNDMRFSGRKTVITPAELKRIKNALTARK